MTETDERTDLIETLAEIEDHVEIETDKGHTIGAWVVGNDTLIDEDDGHLDVTVELDDETYETLDVSTETASITARVDRSGEWTRPAIAIWNPVVEDGNLVSEDWDGYGYVVNVRSIDDE